MCYKTHKVIISKSTVKIMCVFIRLGPGGEKIKGKKQNSSNKIKDR